MNVFTLIKKLEHQLLYGQRRKGKAAKLVAQIANVVGIDGYKKVRKKSN